MGGGWVGGGVRGLRFKVISSCLEHYETIWVVGFPFATIEI